MEWLVANIGTILVCAVLALLLGLAIWYMARSHKRGGCAGCHCEGNCSGCSPETKTKMHHG